MNSRPTEPTNESRDENFREERIDLEKALGEIESLRKIVSLQQKRSELFEVEHEKTADMFQSIIESMDDGVMIEDERGQVIFANKPLVKTLGYRGKSEITQRPWSDFFSLDDEKVVSGNKGIFESLLISSSGKKIPILISSTSFYFEDRYVGVLSVIKDITDRKKAEETLERYRDKLEDLVEERTAELTKTAEQLRREIAERKQAEEKIKYLAHHDNLTNLPNRLLFFDRLQQAFLDADRKQEYVALLFIDLDGFKAVNDEHGHEIGDQVLKDAAGRIKQCMGSADTASRLGGDEFAIILPNQRENRYAESVAKKIIRSINKPFDTPGGKCSIGASIGISMYPIHGRKPYLLLKRSDSAMYEVKNRDGNDYLFYPELPGLENED